MTNYPLVDIIMTSCAFNRERAEVTKLSVQSFITETTYPNARLTTVFDGAAKFENFIEAKRRIEAFDNVLNVGDVAVLVSSATKKWENGTVLFHDTNFGLGPSVNEALGLIFQKNQWHKERDELDKVSQLICYVQDDILYTSGWLEKLVRNFIRFETPMKLGFASGYRSPEHEMTVKQLLRSPDGEMRTQDWIRMTNMLGRVEYWKSMWPISGRDPERGGALRAKPDNGIGSGCDWWFLRDTKNSVCSTGRTNLVIPGLLAHIGHADSTWLSRDLEEHPQDLELIKNAVRKTQGK